MRIPYYGNAQARQSFGVGSTIKYYDPSSWGLEKERLPSPDSFDPTYKYTPWELDRFADAILWEQIQKGHRNFSDPVILMYEHLQDRRRREIYTAKGIPDETITNSLSPDGQTIYWRSHPHGRKLINDPRAGYYR